MKTVSSNPKNFQKNFPKIWATLSMKKVITGIPQKLIPQKTLENDSKVCNSV